MPQSFVSAFTERGDTPALLFPGQSPVTYGELAERIERRARQLPREKKLIAIETEHSEHAIATYLAALEAGHAVAMLPPACCRQGEEFELAFEPDLTCRRVGDRWSMIEALPQPRGGRQGGLHPDLALLLQTSGSTGNAKAVRLSRANIDANADSIAQYLGLTAADRACLVLPLHYSYGLSVLQSHLAVGASLYLPGCSVLADGFLDGLAEQKCTSFAGVPHSYELLETIGFRSRRLPQLRLMTVAGGRMAPDAVRRYNRHMRARDGAFFVMYGQTEATARIAYVPPALLEGNEDRIGVAIPGGAMCLENTAGDEIRRPGQAGELVYRGPNVMMGYAATRADLAAGPQVGALKTGDLAEIDLNGLFRIVGRLKRMSKIAGRRIGHDMLEEALERHGIRAAVVGDDVAVHAFFLGAHKQDTVRKALAAAGGLTLLQVRATAIDALPRLASGKIDYGSLKERFRSNISCKQAVSIRAAFEQVFYPNKVGARDSFVTLGGDSLRFVQLSLALEQTIGEAPAGWETMTVAQLSERSPVADVKATVGVDLLIRAFAILLVVVQHQTLWPVPGGSAAMVVLIGFGLARFQAGALFSGDAARVLRPARQVLAFYYLIVGGYAVAWREVPWASVFLLGNFGFADPVRHDMVPYLYWFVEAYWQMLLVIVGLFASGTVRRVAAADPFAAGMVFFVVAVAMRIVVPPLLDIGNRQIFTLPWILYLAALGWCAAFAGTTGRKLLLFAVGGGVLAFLAFHESVWIGVRVKNLLQVAVLFALLFAPRVRLPSRFKSVVLPISAASFHIYMLHRFVPELFMTPLGAALPPALFSALAIGGGVSIGLAAWWLQGRILSSLARKNGDGILPLLQTYMAERRPRST